MADGKWSRAKNCMWKYFTAIVRLFGILTAACLLAAGILAFKNRPLEFYIGIYYTAVGIVVTILELLFLFSKCRCCSEESRCWRTILWFDNWKKSILYILLAILCFIFPFNTLLGLVSGCMLLVAALLYIMKTCRPDGDGNEHRQLTEVTGDDQNTMNN
ncbi:uncharacterized protein LOC144352778 [Saccoglossus kowalevskii]